MRLAVVYSLADDAGWVGRGAVIYLPEPFVPIASGMKISRSLGAASCFATCSELPVALK